MKLVTEPYLNQVSRWPKNGRHILAQFDDHSIIAIQLGLRDEFLRRYAREWIIDIEDISAFVQQQHQYKGGDKTNLVTPSESVYPVFNADIAEKLGLSANN